MSSKEQALIAELKDLADQGFITSYELNWCSGAIRNRHGLTPATKRQLRDTVHEVIKRARIRMENNIEP